MLNLGLEAQDQRNEAQTHFGKYPGLVLNNSVPDDVSDYGAHRGELLVQVSGILEESPGGAGQRPVEVWAKPSFISGFFFVPEIGSQVWVEFVAGDISAPIWTGVWYPKDAAPDRVEGEKPTEFQKVIRTASGHVMELDDDGSKILILDANGNQFTVDEDGITIVDKTDNEIVMDGDGVKVVDKSGNEIVMASSGVTITSTAIKLGSDSSNEPLVLGNKWFELFNMHMHIGNMGAPTSPPGAAGLKAEKPLHLSGSHTTE